MSFFRSKSNGAGSLTVVSTEDLTPEKIHQSLKKLYDHKKSQDENKSIRRNRELENLRNNFLETTINNIAEHLENTSENRVFCRRELTRLMILNVNQTDYYARAGLKGKSLADVSLGKVHCLCANMMPDALIDALIMMRSTRITKVIEIKNITNPDTGEVTQNKTVRFRSRNLKKLDICLKGIDTLAKKIICADLRIKTLREEIEIEKNFKMPIFNKYSILEKTLLVAAQTLYHDILEDKLDVTQYSTFKNQVVDSSFQQNFNIDVREKLVRFISHMEKMRELIEYGTALSHGEVSHMTLKQ